MVAFQLIYEMKIMILYLPEGEDDMIDHSGQLLTARPQALLKGLIKLILDMFTYQNPPSLHDRRILTRMNLPIQDAVAC